MGPVLGPHARIDRTRVLFSDGVFFNIPSTVVLAVSLSNVWAPISLLITLLPDVNTVQNGLQNEKWAQAVHSSHKTSENLGPPKTLLYSSGCASCPTFVHVAFPLPRPEHL